MENTNPFSPAEQGYFDPNNSLENWAVRLPQPEISLPNRYSPDQSLPIGAVLAHTEPHPPTDADLLLPYFRNAASRSW